MLNRLYLKMFFFVFITLLTNEIQGQKITIYEGQGVNNIKLGKSTIDDVVKEFGDNYKLLSPNNSNKWDPNFDYNNKKRIIFPAIGLVFQCFDTTELIIGVSFQKPFKGITSSGFVFNLDSMTNGSLLENYANLKWHTSDASNFWVLSNDSISFYTIKDKSIPPYPLDKKIYNSKIIHSASFNLDFFSLEVKEVDGLSFYRPLYAPDTSTHLNVGRLIAYTEKIKKEGIWKEYYSNHELKFVGQFIDNYPIGQHEYFDKKSKLISSVEYGKRTQYIFYTLILFTIIIIPFMMIKYIKRNTSKPKHYLYIIIGIGLHLLFYFSFPAGCGGAGLAIVLSVPFIIISSLLLSFIGNYLNRKGRNTKPFFITCLIFIVFISYFTVPFCPDRDPITLLRETLPF